MTTPIKLSFLEQLPFDLKRSIADFLPYEEEATNYQVDQNQDSRPDGFASLCLTSTSFECIRNPLYRINRLFRHYSGHPNIPTIARLYAYALSHSDDVVLSCFLNQICIVDSVAIKKRVLTIKDISEQERDKIHKCWLTSKSIDFNFDLFTHDIQDDFNLILCKKISCNNMELVEEFSFGNSYAPTDEDVQLVFDTFPRLEKLSIQNGGNLTQTCLDYLFQSRLTYLHLGTNFHKEKSSIEETEGNSNNSILLKSSSLRYFSHHSESESITLPSSLPYLDVLEISESSLTDNWINDFRKKFPKDKNLKALIIDCNGKSIKLGFSINILLLVNINELFFKNTCGFSITSDFNWSCRTLTFLNCYREVNLYNFLFPERLKIVGCMHLWIQHFVEEDNFEKEQPLSIKVLEIKTSILQALPEMPLLEELYIENSFCMRNKLKETLEGNTNLRKITIINESSFPSHKTALRIASKLLETVHIENSNHQTDLTLGGENLRSVYIEKSLFTNLTITNCHPSCTITLINMTQFDTLTIHSLGEKISIEKPKTINAYVHNLLHPTPPQKTLKKIARSKLRASSVF